jgi:hypothetical protein
MNAVLLALLFLLLLFGYLFYKLGKAKKGKFPKESSMFSKIVASTFQVNAMALAYSFDWNAAMDSMLGVQEEVTTLGTAYFKLQCIFPGLVSARVFVTDSTFYILFPVLLSLIAGGLVAAWKLCKADGFSSTQGSALLLALGSARTVAILVLYLLQPYLVNRFCLVFSCIRLGNGNNDLFLTEDLSVRCWSPEHNVYILALGLPLLTVYVLGFPLSILWLLTRNRSTVGRAIDVMNKIHSSTATQAVKSTAGAVLSTAEESKTVGDVKQNADEHHRKHNALVAFIMDSESDEEQNELANQLLTPSELDFVHSYAFLFLGYTNVCFYWEVVMMARKAVVSVLAIVLAAEDVRTQGVLGLATMFLSTVAHSRFQPLVDPFMDRFELFSLCISSFTFFCGVLTLDAGESGQSVVSASTWALAVNVLYFMVAAGLQLKLLITEKLNDKRNQQRRQHEKKLSVQGQTLELAVINAFPGTDEPDTLPEKCNMTEKTLEKHTADPKRSPDATEKSPGAKSFDSQLTSPSRSIREAHLEKRCSMFQAIDVDGDGSVSFDELVAYFIANGLSQKKAVLKAGEELKATDLDGDGNVSQEEFLARPLAFDVTRILAELVESSDSEDSKASAKSHPEVKETEKTAPAPAPAPTPTPAPASDEKTGEQVWDQGGNGIKAFPEEIDTSLPLQHATIELAHVDGKAADI